MNKTSMPVNCQQAQRDIQPKAKPMHPVKTRYANHNHRRGQYLIGPYLPKWLQN